MNWLILILAAFFEIGWPVGFKMSSLHPEQFGLYIALGSLSMLLSGVLFYFCTKDHSNWYRLYRMDRAWCHRNFCDRDMALRRYILRIEDVLCPSDTRWYCGHGGL